VRDSVCCDQREPAQLKTTSGRRDVPIIARLRGHLETSPAGDAGAFVFGNGDVPFTPATIRRRAFKPWNAAELEPVALQAARHTFASILIASGVNAKQLSVYMGHASIQTTYDVYGWLLSGSAEPAVSLVDAYLDRADSASRIASLATHMPTSDPQTTGSNGMQSNSNAERSPYELLALPRHRKGGGSSVTLSHLWDQVLFPVHQRQRGSGLSANAYPRTSGWLRFQTTTAALSLSSRKQRTRPASTFLAPTERS
jgi:hypothetical protein